MADLVTVETILRFIAKEDFCFERIIFPSVLLSLDSLDSSG